jgi:AcrR family transcriptional regulator
MAPKQKSSSKVRHHHGDLKRSLVIAGMELLAEGGLDALTLRKCAARAGVSHAAPAHHFKGLKGLLTAIVAEGFEMFTNSMVSAREASDDDPYARLAGICSGYLDFSARHEAVATLMFMKDRFDVEDPDFQRTSSASYQVLAETCAPFKASGDGPKSTETQIWSLVQGYAHLVRSGMINSGETPFPEILPKLELKEI